MNCKTQEGAYSYLKVFTGDRHSKMEDQEAPSKAKKIQVQGEDDEADADDAHSEEAEIVSRLGLSALALTGMKAIETSKDYEKLFGTTNPGQLTALDIKLLELRLELLLWDRGCLNIVGICGFSD